MPDSGHDTAAIAAKYRAFAGLVKALGAVWLSNEAPEGVPGTAADHEDGHFVLAENGTRAIAHTDPHGTWLRWVS